MQALTIRDWVKHLTTIRKEDFTIPRVVEFTQTQAISPETLGPYLFYSKSHYTRNLIYKCELFEVIAICWEVGQVSRIHNHRDQNCWMVAPIGRLRVQNFRVGRRNHLRRACNLTPTDVYEMDNLHPAVVQPHEPVHQVDLGVLKRHVDGVEVAPEKHGGPESQVRDIGDPRTRQYYEPQAQH